VPYADGALQAGKIYSIPLPLVVRKKGKKKLEISVHLMRLAAALVEICEEAGKLLTVHICMSTAAAWGIICQ